MDNKRVVIVGASSGLGRAIGIALGQRGHRVAFLARRAERVVAAAAEAGLECIGLACDVTDEAGARSAIDQAASALGGIDAVIYATGIGPLARIEETTAATWRSVFETNVIGASTIAAAALPHVRESQGKVVFLSSVAASMTAPWAGLATYNVSKVAMDRLIEAWRVEHPDVGFVRLVVGECSGGTGESQSEFNVDWDPALRAEFGPGWFAKGYITGALVAVEELINVTETVVRGGPSMHMPVVMVTSRPIRKA